MLIRDLMEDLYGERIINQIRPDYRFYLDRQHDQLTQAELLGLAYGLHLHGTTGSILYAWECRIRELAVTERATHGNQGNRHGRTGWDSL